MVEQPIGHIRVAVHYCGVDSAAGVGAAPMFDQHLCQIDFAAKGGVVENGDAMYAICGRQFGVISQEARNVFDVAKHRGRENSERRALVEQVRGNVGPTHMT